MSCLKTPYLLLIIATLLLGACGDSSQRAHNVSSNPAVEAQAAQLLEAIQSGNDELIVKQYSQSFFVKHSPQEWLQTLKTLMAERGPMRSFSLARSQADTRFSGKFYILEYNSVHDGRKRLHHTLTFLLPVGGGDIELNGHKILPWEAKTE